MNLIKPLSWFSRKSAASTGNQGGAVAAATRAASPMGAWTGVFSNWEPRAVSPWLYEALKEAVPILDAGISRLVTLDGIIEVEGDNDKLVAEIEEWMRNVPVNDLETGFQAAYASSGEELYEQGLAIAEFVYAPNGKDVIGIRTADSKGIGFIRDTDRMRVMYRAPGHGGDPRADGMSNVQDILRGAVRGNNAYSLLADKGFVELDPAQLMMCVNRPEADNPYGTSVLRSLPFVAQIILRMQNATGRVWERFGDPSFHVNYSTKNRKIDNAEAMSRAGKIAAALSQAMAGKATGNSVDLATGVGADDEIKVEVIGAVKEALQIEMPAKHMIEQVVSAFNLPAWMLGVSWAQASGIGEPQAELVLQDSKTRYARREPSLRRPIEAMLRARGRTWRSGDWKVVQRLPSLHDVVKRAQANFLNAQAEKMSRDGGGGGTGLDNQMRHAGRQHRKAADDDAGGERWAESDKQLPRIEAATAGVMVARWHGTRRETLHQLGLDAPTGDSYTFNPAQLTWLLAEAGALAQDLAASLLEGSLEAWDRGIANAAEELAPSKHTAATRFKASPLFDDPLVIEAIERMREAIREQLIEHGMELVTGGVARRLRDHIITALASGEFDGQNPVNVARELATRFDAGDYNWERLARSEIADAQVGGKLDLYREQGVIEYDYETAGDSLVSRICRELEAGGPYRLDDTNAPRPMRDSHPGCRCTIVARA